MRIGVVLTMVAASLACPALGQETYRIDPLHTATTFSVTHLGLSHQRGSFGKTTGVVTFDRKAKTGSIDVTIDASSVTSGSTSREQMLRGEDYFDVARYPNIVFKATNLKFEGDNLVGCDGELTMRGVTRPVTLSVAEFKCDIHPATKKPVCGAEVTAHVSRAEFGMVKNQASTSDDVVIAIAIEAIQQ